MGAESDKSRPPWSSRLLAVGCYLGLGPLLSLVGRWRNDVYSRHHRPQALITVLLLFLLALGLPIYFSIEAYLVRHYPRPYMPDLTTVFLPGLGLWGLFSVAGIGMSLAGSTRSIPVVGRLGRSRWLTRLACVANSLLLTFVVLVIGLTVHATSLARGDAVPAPVYFLYDGRDYEFLGPWGPHLNALFCYRIARVAQERWGPGSVVVAPLTVDNFRTAITHGRFAVLTGHGSLGAVQTVDAWTVWPNFPATFATPGKDLQYVYISACCGGEKAPEWEQRFAPAQVVTFNRLSTGGEHLWWLWFEAPDRLRQIR
jgi:hypothetical protein